MLIQNMKFDMCFGRKAIQIRHVLHQISTTEWNREKYCMTLFNRDVDVSTS